MPYLLRVDGVKSLGTPTCLQGACECTRACFLVCACECILDECVRVGEWVGVGVRVVCLHRVMCSVRGVGRETTRRALYFDGGTMYESMMCMHV